ncbi:MAG TPA: hypothetical protein PLO37_04865 [Candidatus Hydrogenedentes bacterium]|nr:hypothetical protein [Candidatus Hydrogenedentota bacterium]
MARTQAAIPPGVDLSELARRVSYIGSPEHKTYPLAGSNPNLRSDASKCDKALVGREDDIAGWLRRAIGNGWIGAPWEGEFPRYAWHRVDDVVFEARLVNRDTGEYKGYPLEEDEYPEGI